jgi:hypothetical protein
MNFFTEVNGTFSPSFFSKEFAEKCIFQAKSLIKLDKVKWKKMTKSILNLTLIKSEDYVPILCFK